MRLALEKVKKALESKWFVAPLFAIALVFQLLGLYDVNVLLCATLLSLILVICDDVKNLFAIIFYASFFICNIFSSANWLIYGIAIGITCSSFIYFAIAKIIKKSRSGEKFITSRIFIPLCIVSIFYCLGGIFSNFSLIPFLVTLGFSLVVLFFVFIAPNFTKGLKEYLPFVFTLGAILIMLLLFLTNVIEGKSILSIFNHHSNISHPSVGAQNINVAALFILIGMISAFSLGFKKKYGYLTLILATVLAFAILTTSCRMVIALGALAFIALAIYSLVKTPYKKSYAITSGVILILAVAFLLIDFSLIENILSSIIHKNESSRFFSGRLDIWSWCLDRFVDSPLFGYGFVSKPSDGFPLDSNPSGIILAHNTIIQWLGSLGTVGTLAMLFFTFCKYKIVLGATKTHGIFIPTILLIITLSGLTDQAAQMDIFVHSLSLVTLVSIDDFSPFKTLISLKKSKTRNTL